MELTWFNFYDPVVDPLVLAGSALSLLSTSLVLLTFAVYFQEQRTFRHALVFNLTLSEFFNSLNATFSGSYFLDTRAFTPGTLCTVNGWIGQVSVQASDFSMLAIAVFTLLTITEKVYMPAVSITKKTLICISVWVIPLTSGCVAVGMGVMVPAGANWCWISASRTDLRYALTHAWRFAIIFAIICIYVYVYVYTSRRFKFLDSIAAPTDAYGATTHARKSSAQKSPYDTAQASPPLTLRPQKPEELQIPRYLRDSSWLRLSMASEKDVPQQPKSVYTKDTAPLLDRTVTATPPPYPEARRSSSSSSQDDAVRSTSMFGTVTKVEAGRGRSPENRRIEREVKRMLLMNAYPIFYVVLSVPGLVNRLLQASGSPAPDRTLNALQAASAFIGFTNAVTYGFNRHLRDRMAADIRNWKARRGTGGV